MKLVDTNILVNAINRDSTHCESCCAALESLVNGTDTWAIAWTNIYEFLRVATHPRVFPEPLQTDDAWRFVDGLIQRPNSMTLTETQLHAEVLAQCLKEAPRVTGDLLHDFHLAVLMREHGVSRILTLDSDFRAFSWLSVEEP